MSDIIHLLPDSVANQIAAGEVIQRPASVVKELVENAIDANATKIQIIVKGAGRTSIQVIDNGKGMSETDARMAFERHATSKITQAADLFSLRTMGFRGEALASIAAVAQVELRTKLHDSDLGVLLEIAGSKVLRQEPVSCPDGTSFLIKSLFFNVPARRKFLKSDEAEMRHIIAEVQRIVLVNPHIEFQLFSGDDIIYDLPIANFKQRIVAVFGKKNRTISQQLVQAEAKTQLVEISGFIGKPEFATKSASQFFFVNGRYMRHPFFHKAVMLAYERLLQPDENPSYFIALTVDPNAIDVNIHPTKTEIKFQDEREIFSILMVCVKESLGKFNVTPSLDFDQEGRIDIPIRSGNQTVTPPNVKINHDYNPFNTYSAQKTSSNNWEALYKGVQNEKTETQTVVNQQLFEEKEERIASTFFQYRNRYIFTTVKSGLMVIDQQRALQRILFEEITTQLSNKQTVSQKLLFPEIFDLDVDEVIIFEQIKDKVVALGFDLEPFGKQTYAINGVPALLAGETNVVETLMNLIADVKEKGQLNAEWETLLALRLAKSSAKTTPTSLSQEEMSHLVDQLFACQNPNLTADGKKIVSIIAHDELEKRF